MKRINRTRLLVGCLVALVVGLALLASRHEGGERTPPVHLSDTTPEGGRALGFVMEHLGYKTQSQNAPLSQMPSDARVWFLLDSQTTFSDKEADALLAWVKKGGVLFWATPSDSDGLSFFSSAQKRPGVDRLKTKFGFSSLGSPQFDANGLPKMVPLNLDSASNYRVGVSGASSSGTTLSLMNEREEPGLSRATLQIASAPGGSLSRVDEGRGHIFLIPDAWMLTNYGLSHPANATLVANLVRVHLANANGGAAYFDERQHDNTLAPPASDDWPARLRQKPVVFAVWQLLVVGLGTLALVSRRLGAPVPLPTNAPVTRASGFARAMGGLLLKASRPKAAAQIIGESFRARLAKRVGMSPRESDEVLSARASEISGISREVLSRALMNSRAPATNETSALRDAQEMERLLDQLG